jgi:DNA-binding winged helix-turn-helix (wHTH) protein
MYLWINAIVSLISRVVGHSMSVYQFYEFEFNREKYQLSKNGTEVSIRPKTALVLSHLIENRHVIVSKNELFEAVWQTPHVQNHTLFQVISEIRKLSDEGLIRTQPNRGYQWLAPTRLIAAEQSDDSRDINLSAVVIKPLRKNNLQSVAMAASLALLACTSFFLGQWSSQTDQASPAFAKGSNSLPAINAYAKGVVAFEAGQYGEAKQWFDFSLLEDPSSVQSKLMLAESYFKQQHYTRAQDVAFKLLDSVDKNSYHYSSTSDLLSRIYAQQGLVFDALSYAISGANSLQNSNAYCSIEVSEQRIEILAQQLVDDENLKTDKEKLLAGYYKRAQQGEQSSATVENELSEFNSLCEQVNEKQEENHVLIDDTSACLKPESRQWLLSYHYYYDESAAIS